MQKFIFFERCRNQHFEKNEIEVYNQFLRLCDDYGFLQAIKASDKKSFLMRFTYLDNMLRGILHDTKN